MTLVFDRNFGAWLELIASASHVWVIDTPTNRIFAEDYWRQGVDDRLSGNITTFKVSDGTPDILDIFDLFGYYRFASRFVVTNSALRCFGSYWLTAFCNN